MDVTIKGSSDYVTRQVNSVDEPTHSDVVIRNIPVGLHVVCSMILLLGLMYVFIYSCHVLNR